MILVRSVPKIIDILYRDSLALLSAASRDVRGRCDLLDLRLLLYDALLKSELDPADATDFNAALTSDADLASIRLAFEAVLNPARGEDLELKIEHALQRIRDEGFVEGDLDARALAQETPDSVCLPLLKRLLTHGGITYKHRPYLRLLWDRLTDLQKNDIARDIGTVLDRETPKGKWSTPINMLAAFAADGWRRLPQASRLRFESVIVNDILAGYYDIYGTNIGNPGILGTYANTFWSYFRDRDRLVDNIAALLKTN